MELLKLQNYQQPTMSVVFDTIDLNTGQVTATCVCVQQASGRPLYTGQQAAIVWFR